MKKYALILCGSGFRDGSEIRESVAILWALSQHPVEVSCFAPDAPQTDVINTFTMKPVDETRNMLVEAARIARGRIEPLSKLDPKTFSGVLIPGGFGVAKNLCTFATEGAKGHVRPDVEQLLHAFHDAHKPIGAVCIAPAVVALAFKGKGFELTVGADGESAREIEKLGHKHVVKPVTECHVDVRNRIITTPAYMYGDAVLYELFQGVHALVSKVIDFPV